MNGDILQFNNALIGSSCSHWYGIPSYGHFTKAGRPHEGVAGVFLLLVFQPDDNKLLNIVIIVSSHAVIWQI